MLVQSCVYGEQCQAGVAFSQCKNNWCTCLANYRINYKTGQCIHVASSSDSRSALQIYKITMIFASACLAVILLIFLTCILRKSYCPSDPGFAVHPIDDSLPNLFTIFPDLAGPVCDQPPFNVRPPFEKPPTYDESQRATRAQLGTPPPAYSPGPSQRDRNSTLSTTCSTQALTASTSGEVTTATATSPTRSAGVDNGAFDGQE